MTVKKSELSRILLDLKYVGGLIKLLDEYNKQFNSLDMVKRIEDDFELISLLCKHLEEVNK